MKCTNPRCSQHPDLYQTGASAKQGCTHHCRICGWGYWTHEIKPTIEEIKAAEAAHPKYTRDVITKALTREVLRSKPEGSDFKVKEKKMIEQLGSKDRPHWLQNDLKIIWRKKYIKMFPDSLLAKANEERKKPKYDQTS